MSRILITGTDTGVGKTLVSSVILKKLSSMDLSVGALKPVETGCQELEGELVASDVEWLFNALGGKIPKEDLILKKYRSPVAPKVAAEFEGKALNWSYLLQETTRLASKHENFLVEGAGGLLVPITEAKTYADLAKECDLEVVLVFGSKLGAINHGALSFEAAKNRGLKLAGYIYNELEPQSESREGVVSARQTNRALISEVAEAYGARELGYLPYFPKLVGLDDLDRVCKEAKLEKFIEWIKD